MANIFCTTRLSQDDTRSWDVQQLLYMLTSELFPKKVQDLAREVREKIRNQLGHFQDQDGKVFRVKAEYRKWYVDC